MKHHWEGMEPDPETMYGFIYEIVNNLTGQRYIGRKFYHKYRKRKRWAGSDWEFYTGSSTHLNKDIKKLGKDNFTFTIIDQYKTRGGVVYGEVEWLVMVGALTTQLPDGSGRLYYNRSIGGIRFVPVESHTEETIAKMSEAAKGENNSMYGVRGLDSKHSDKTVYHWYNKFNDSEEKLTRYELIQKYSLNDGHVCHVIKGGRNHCLGWCLYEKRKGFKANKTTIGEQMTITNDTETHTGTQKELSDKLDLIKGCLSLLKAGKRKTHKGWKLKK